VDEALRRAYLEAMGIPVWIPRDEADPLAAAPEPAPRRPEPRAEAAMAGATPGAGAVRDGAAPIPRPGQGRAMLGESTRAAAKRESAPSPPLRPPARSGGTPEALSLRLARAGSSLFLDEVTEPRSARAATELLSSLAFVLERRRIVPELQLFDWPPRNMPFVAAEARDAVRARIARLGDGALRRLVLMGPRPACLLLDWEPAQWDLRPNEPVVIPGLECAVLLLPSAETMLRSPDSKRLAWQSLRLAPRDDG
jgi:hypothetical protein